MNQCNTFLNFRDEGRPKIKIVNPISSSPTFSQTEKVGHPFLVRGVQESKASENVGHPALKP